MRLRGLAVLLPALLSGGAACTHHVNKPPSQGDSESGPVGGASGGGGSTPLVGDGGTTTSGDGGACTDLTNRGNVVDELSVVGDFVGTGGDIADGTYTIIEARLYLGNNGTGVPGLTGRTYSGAIRVQGTTYESVLVTSAGGTGGSEVLSLGTLTPNGVSALLQLTCPASGQEQLSYSATGTTLTLSNPATRVAFVFSKSP